MKTSLVATTSLLASQTALAHMGEHSESPAASLIHFISQPDHLLLSLALAAALAGAYHLAKRRQ